MGITTLAASGTLAVILFLAACGGSSKSSPTPEASPSPVAMSALGAVMAYVQQNGLDGEDFNLTDPIACDGFVLEEDKPKAIGKVCVDFRNTGFSATEGFWVVRLFNTERAWKVFVEAGEAGWVGTRAEYVGG